MREIKFRAWDKGRMIEPMGLLMRDAPQWLDKLSSEAILMQYTGLHDKNGKEIWEGDILIDHKRKYICSWKKEETAFVIYGEDKYKNTTIGHRAGSGKWVQRYFVVIGNIYENPELIEDAPQT
jgi:uncharacterized phage protein (TIGR01671 family)